MLRRGWWCLAVPVRRFRVATWLSTGGAEAQLNRTWVAMRRTGRVATCGHACTFVSHVDRTQPSTGAWAMVFLQVSLMRRAACTKSCKQGFGGSSPPAGSNPIVWQRNSKGNPRRTGRVRGRGWRPACRAAEQVLGHRTAHRPEPDDAHPVGSWVHGVILPKVGHPYRRIGIRAVKIGSSSDVGPGAGNGPWSGRQLAGHNTGEER